MDPMRDLPMGFGMALMRNPAALKRFESMTSGEQQTVLSQLHSIGSRDEMQSFVAALAPNAIDPRL